MRWGVALGALLLLGMGGVSARPKVGTKKHPLRSYQNPAEPFDNSGGTFSPEPWVREKPNRNLVRYDNASGFPLRVYVAPAATHVYREVATEGEVWLPKGEFLLGAGTPDHFEYGPVTVRFKGKSGGRYYWTLMPIGATP